MGEPFIPERVRAKTDDELLKAIRADMGIMSNRNLGRLYESPELAELERRLKKAMKELAEPCVQVGEGGIVYKNMHFRPLGPDTLLRVARWARAKLDAQIAGWEAERNRICAHDRPPATCEECARQRAGGS